MPTVSYVPDLPRSFDIVAWSANADEPGYGHTTTMDCLGESWPDSRLVGADGDADIQLAEFLTTYGDDGSDEGFWTVLVGHNDEYSWPKEEFTWVAHPYLLPLGLELHPWSLVPADPETVVRIRYAQVIGDLTIDLWRRGERIRYIRIGTSEEPWVIHGEQQEWERPFWDGRQPWLEEFGDAQPTPWGLQSPDRRWDAGHRIRIDTDPDWGLGPRLPDAATGDVVVRDGATFWASRPGVLPPDVEEAARRSGSFIEDGRAFIRLDSLYLEASATASAAEEDLDEWPDVAGLCHAALSNLLGIESSRDLQRAPWMGYRIARPPST